MEQSRPAVNRPWWVKVTLLGLPNRASAMAFVWVLLALAAAAAVGNYWGRRYSVGALLVKRAGFAIKGMVAADVENLVQGTVVLALVVAALGYFVAVWWVDRHGGWS